MKMKVKVCNVSRAFGAVKALDRVSFELTPGCLYGKTYRYEDFMASGSSSGGSSQGGMSKQKPKIRGGHLRDLLNYSDRF